MSAAAVIEGIVVWRRDGGREDDDAAWSQVALSPLKGGRAMTATFIIVK